MADLHQVWSEDLVLSATGDLLLTDGSEAGRQRVLRRLLTSPGSYLWAMEYGAGLPQQVGETTRSSTIEALVRRQMFLEPVVEQSPPPNVQVSSIVGGVSVHIQYQDAFIGTPVGIGFSVER